MANERVSQLNQLLVTEIQANDVFLVTDTSQRESKKLQIGDVVTYVQTEGTFNAVHSSIADTASYIKASNIDGLQIANVVASQSISSSYSAFSLSSSHSNMSDTASYAVFSIQSMVNAQTASYLLSSSINGTASYAAHTQLADVATLALNLYYDGINPNGTSSYSVNSGLSQFSINATNAAQSAFSTNATSAQNAFFASSSISSSWASSSISSSYSVSSSVSLLGITASYISVLSGQGRIDGTVDSSSFARSASYSKTSSYARIAFNVINATPAPTTILGHTWNIVNPRAAFANNNNLYVISQVSPSTASMFQINKTTNVVTPFGFINSSSFTNSETYFWGRIFISNYDNVTPFAIINTRNGLYNYNFTTNTFTTFRSTLTVNSGAYIQNDLPVQADFNTPAGNTFGNIWPSYYCLHGSAAGNDSGGGGQFPMLTMYKLVHTGTSPTTSGSYVRNSIATVNISKVVNNGPFLQFYNNVTSSAYNTLLWDYNPIAQTFYMIDVSTGFLSIFNQSVPITNSTFLASNITYVGTYAVTLPHTDVWSNANTDRFIVDYNLTNGIENGLILVKAGNASYGGTVSYIPWPANGN